MRAASVIVSPRAARIWLLVPRPARTEPSSSAGTPTGPAMSAMDPARGMPVAMSYASKVPSCATKSVCVIGTPPVPPAPLEEDEDDDVVVELEVELDVVSPPLLLLLLD